MINKTGYKQMLRDRCPKLVSYALKWCKVKEAWLKHVYQYSICLEHKSKHDKLIATRKVLGYKDPKNMKNKQREFKFEDTLHLEAFESEEERIFWKKMIKFVSWFQKTVPLIEDEYKISKLGGAELIDLKRGIILNWLSDYFPTTQDDEKVRKEKNKFVNDLADYLIDCFENLN